MRAGRIVLGLLGLVCFTVPVAGHAQNPLLATSVTGMPVSFDDCKVRVQDALLRQGYGELDPFGNGWQATGGGGTVSIGCIRGSRETVLMIVAAGADHVGRRDRLLAAVRAGAATPSASQLFLRPTYKDQGVDLCLHWGRDCGKPAADAFCRLQGYRESVSHSVQGNSPPTWVLGDNRSCAEPGCGRLAEVSCSGGAEIQRVAGGDLGIRWATQEDGGWTGVWTRRGTSDTFDAVWARGTSRVTGPVVISVAGGRMQGVSNQQSNRYQCDYIGTLSADGLSASGKVTCVGAGTSSWRATISR